MLEHGRKMVSPWYSLLLYMVIMAISLLNSNYQNKDEISTGNRGKRPPITPGKNKKIKVD